MQSVRNTLDPFSLSHTFTPVVEAEDHKSWVRFAIEHTVDISPGNKLVSGLVISTAYQCRQLFCDSMSRAALISEMVLQLVIPIYRPLQGISIPASHCCILIKLDSLRQVDWVMGYLNYQVIHHMFPAMPQFRGPAVSKELQQLAKWVECMISRHECPLYTSFRANYCSFIKTT
jgi:hypothetical protein